MVEGKLQREGEVVHVIVKRCFDLRNLLRELTATETNDQLVLTLSRSMRKRHNRQRISGRLLGRMCRRIYFQRGGILHKC